MVSVGAGDTSFSLGRPVEYDRPDVNETGETVQRAGAEHGVPMYQSLGFHSDSMEGARAAIDDGNLMLRLGTDRQALRRVHGDRVVALR